MKRRRWLRWGCAHCMTLAGLAQAQAPASSPAAGWTSPPRFTRPDLATDEGGLWALMDREEQRLRRSPFRVRDEALNGYLTDLACRLGSSHCPDIRVYAIRAPWFNASMAPNGMMQVWTGLLLRVENEAQLASVIGHEIGHYLQRHTIERLRDLRARSAFGTFLSLFGVVGAIGAIANMAAALAFSRDQERDADRIGIDLMRGSGHDPREAAVVWANLLDELKATPGADPTQSSILFATHPPSDERRATLDALSIGTGGDKGEAAFRERLAPLRRGLLEDELKRGRPFETVALMTRLLGREPGSGELLHGRGEAYRQRGSAGDADLALADLQAACAAPSVPAVAFRSLAEMHRAAGRPEPARDAFRRYLDLAPDAPDAAMVRQTLEDIKP
jgi:beta-barrel assembly-enhancing protease